MLSNRKIRQLLGGVESEFQGLTKGEIYKLYQRSTKGIPKKDQINYQTWFNEKIVKPANTYEEDEDKLKKKKNPKG